MPVDVPGPLISRIQELSANSSTPAFIALDGRSGVGKSTLAEVVARATGACVIDGDDFYDGGTAEQWDAMTPAQKVDHCIDWRRQSVVLDTLWRGETAVWHPYDWIADDGHFADETLTCEPGALVILEGAYSARPELAPFFALRVLLKIDESVRRLRLRQREGQGFMTEWHERWSAAEDHYFANIVPEASYDLVAEAQAQNP